MKTAVIFARVSSSNDRQNTERQINDLTNYANKNDFEIVKIFTEHISGAKKNEERTVLMDCINFCISNNINSLLCSELSRVGRSTLQVLKTLEALHENGVNIYVQNLSINTLNENKQVNPIASILLTVMAEMSNIERQNIQYRLNSGRQTYIANGGKLGRKKGSTKSTEQKKQEYSEVISLLKRGYSIRNTAKLTGFGSATVQRVKTEFSL